MTNTLNTEIDFGKARIGKILLKSAPSVIRRAKKTKKSKKITKNCKKIVDIFRVGVVSLEKINQSVDEETPRKRTFTENPRTVRAEKDGFGCVTSEQKGRKPFRQVEPFRDCCVKA